MGGGGMRRAKETNWPQVLALVHVVRGVCATVWCGRRPLPPGQCSLFCIQLPSADSLFCDFLKPRIHSELGVSQVPLAPY